MPADHDDVPPPLVDRLARASVKARLFGAPQEAARVGRFAILGPIGAGGMGVVYAAYDDELGRKVAIKLVRPGRDDPDIRVRTRREAQALARLSHPNVVQVYEVGEYQGQVYVAMEYIQGKTLRAWQTAAPRPWRELVAMYRQVGLGLAAAHARGLVHRDFKPDNVLVGDDDQRPRVLDFGLARVRAREPAPDLAPAPFEPLASDDLSRGPSPPSSDLSREPSASALTLLAPSTPDPAAPPSQHLPDLSLPPASAPTLLAPTPPPDLSLPPASPDARLTVPGAVLGTPAYMAPEQLAGGDADARSDVFSYCVALHEALLRARPFAGDRSDTLLAAVRRGELVRPERPPDVPAWLLRIVERGLAADPAARWPAMDPLLAALARDPTRWRRRLGLALLALGLAALAVLALLDWRDRRLATDRAAELAAEQARTADAEAAATLARAAADSERRRNAAHGLAHGAAQVAATDPNLGLLLAIEAVRVHHDAGEAPTLAAAQALRDALGNVTSAAYVPPGAPEIVDFVAESPDGAWLATGQRSGAVTLWSTADPRRPHALLPAIDRPVRALEFSATRLAALRGEPGGPHVWTLPATPDPSDMRPVRWASPEPDLHDLAWSPDGAALLARAGATAVVLRADAPARVLRGHTAQIRRALWSPGGAEILTTASDATARLWRLPAATATVHTFPASPTAAAFAPDGRSFAVAAARSVLRVPLPAGRSEREDHREPAAGLGFTPDGELLVATSDGTVHPWRDPAGDTTHTAMSEVLAGVRFAPDADLLLGTPDGGAAYVWQRSRPGDPLVLHGHDASVVAARFSTDGRRVLTGSADGTARRWHILDDPDLLRGHDAGIEHAGFAADARRVVTSAMDGSVRVWPRDGHPPTFFGGHREGSSVRAAFSPDGARLAIAGSDGVARLWALDAPSPQLLATIPDERTRGPALVALAWHPRGDLLVLAADDGHLHLVRPGPPVRTDSHRLAPPGSTAALALDPAAPRMIAAGDDATVRVWRLADPPVLSDTLTGHTATIRDLALAGPRIVSVGDDHTVRLWAPGAEPVVLRGHRGAVSQVRVHPDGRTLLTASADGTARLWSHDAPAELLTGHTDALWLAAWSPDGAEILTASADGTARLWSHHDGSWRGVLLPQHGAPGSADPALWTGGFSPDGRLALVAGADALARVFPVRIDDQLARACARVARSIDPAAWTRHLGDRPLRPTCPDAP